ncbi:MAG: assimilatory sulfite reductase (NADPH) hemoprotein subunit [Bacteroidales bacterium]
MANEIHITDPNQLSGVELIKHKSNYLRGTLKESLDNKLTGSLAEDDTQIIKFHGSYQQTDRDLDAERKKQKLEPLYSFMIRVRMPGGIASPVQWLEMDALSDTYGNSTIKLTTRQTFQLHGIFKRNLKTTMKRINKVLLDTIAACGDVNRNVMCTPNPGLSPITNQVMEFAQAISTHLLPKTKAYYEIWINDEQVVTTEEVDIEPIYGKRYLPRKFKIGIAIPPYNDTDIFSQDIGLIAIEDEGKLAGFNIVAGGGLGTTFGMPETYPRLGSILGYSTPDKIIDIVEKIVTIQRDFGNRENRKLSRMKYTIDAMGVEAFTTELHKRLGYSLEPQRPFTFIHNGDKYGWVKDKDNRWHYCLFVEHGRVKDTEKLKLKTALKEIAQNHIGDFRLTGNQNLLIANITENNKPIIERILKKYSIDDYINKSGLRRNSLACVALNTCSLAFAEAERYLPSLIDKIEPVLERLGLSNEDINIRMTGCPNGCARPWLGEIAFIGRSPGYYNMYLGAAFNGERLSVLYKEMLDEPQIIQELTKLFELYASQRVVPERFGDFVIRKGIVKKGQEVEKNYSMFATGI